MIRQIDGMPEHMNPKDQKRQLIDTLCFRMVLTARHGAISCAESARDANSRRYASDMPRRIAPGALW